MKIHFTVSVSRFTNYYIAIAIFQLDTIIIWQSLILNLGCSIAWGIKLGTLINFSDPDLVKCMGLPI